MNDQERMIEVRKLVALTPEKTLGDRLGQIAEIAGEKKKRKKTGEGTHDRQHRGGRDRSE